MSSVTTINATDVVANSRATINTNFSNLNSDKLEGPASSTDNAIARFDLTTGKLLQQSIVTLSDTGVFLSSGIITLQTSGDGSSLTLLTSNSTTTGVSAGNVSVTMGSGTVGDATGGGFIITGGNGFGSSAGGRFQFVGGSGGATGVGGAIVLTAGAGGSTSGTGGAITLTAGNGSAGNANGGHIILKPGDAHGVGVNGLVKLQDSSSGFSVELSTAIIGSSDKTITFPNATGTFDLTDNAATLTNKTIALGSNTISGTTAQFNTALSDGDFATLAGTETLTNKTLTTPRITNDILDSAGATSIRIGATVSAVEYFTLTNATSGSTCSFSSTAALQILTGGDGQPLTLTTSSGTTNGSTGGNLVATLGNASTSGGNALGGRFIFTGGNGFGSSAGGSFTLTAGNGGATGGGGPISLTAGNGGATSGAGGAVSLTGGNGTAGSANGGQVVLRGGLKASGGADGYVKIVDPTSLIAAIFSTASLASSDKTFTFPNETGTILTSATTTISTTSLTGTGTVTLASGTAAASTVFSTGLAGSTDTQQRISIPVNTTALTANTSYAAMFIRGSVIEATSGTHPILCTLGLKALTVTSGAATVTDTALVYLEGPATATVTGINYTLWVDDGPSRFDGRVLGAKGADLTAAGDLTLGADGNFWDVTGSTTINAITTSGWTAGSRITLKFEAAVTVKHNTAGGAGTATMLLAGAADMSATANDTLSLLYDGTNWLETGRAVI